MSHTFENSRRVVITAVGPISPIGIGADAFWTSLAEGRSGIARFSLPTHTGSSSAVGGEVRDFTEDAAKKNWLKDQRKNIRVMCREIQLAAASANIALAHSALDLEKINHERIGVDFGANLMLSPPEVLADAAKVCTDPESPLFRYEDWGEKGIPAMEPLWLLRYLPNMPACHIGIKADARGPSNSITLEEASGNLTLSEATRVIQRDWADVMIAGTTGTRIHSVKSIHARLWDQVADFNDPPETWSRPFDATRNGQVLGEGACTLLLEEEQHAKARGATIYGTILGAGSSCVVRRDGTADQRLALKNAMLAALRDSGVTPAEVGHINAHGLSTKEADRAEAAAILDVFGDELGRRVPVTALKSVWGNTGASCGTLELAASLLGLKNGVVPATLNYRHPDPECPLNVVHGSPAAATNPVAMKLSVTRMGQASVVLVRGA